jgi:hypothetical protein
MAGNAFALTSADDGVYFDLNADGIPEKIAWTAPASDDAWLAMNRTANGLSDSGAELFGNRTWPTLTRPCRRRRTVHWAELHRRPPMGV